MWFPLKFHAEHTDIKFFLQATHENTNYFVIRKLHTIHK